MYVMKTFIPKGTLRWKKNLPWLTKNLIHAMHKRKWLYRMAKASRQSSWKGKYTAARNRTLTIVVKC